jgi:hypothetical protein
VDFRFVCLKNIRREKPCNVHIQEKENIGRSKTAFFKTIQIAKRYIKTDIQDE